MLQYISVILWIILLPLFNFTHSIPSKEGPVPKSKLIKWAIQKSSNIRIAGSTNTNNFECDITGYYQPDTILCSEEHPIGKLVTLNGELKIDISRFDCHNRILTSDLRKTLKSNEYPNLIIRFLSLERAPVINNDKDFLRGWVEIELAGTLKRLELHYAFVKSGNALLRLNGQRSFSFADFKLTPPKKLAGLIKVRDKFNVDFNLTLSPVE